MNSHVRGAATPYSLLLLIRLHRYFRKDPWTSVHLEFEVRDIYYIMGADTVLSSINLLLLCTYIAYIGPRSTDIIDNAKTGYN